MDPLLGRIEHVTQSVVEPLHEPVTEPPAGESFEALYRRSLPRVYGYVASLLQDRSAAEDVTAQAFERAYRKRGSFRASRGSAEAWLFGIARNAALDELRRRKRRAALHADPEDLSSPAAEEYAELTLRRETVRAALATLDPASGTSCRLSSRADSPTPRSHASCACPSRTPARDFTEPSRSSERPAMTTPEASLSAVDAALEEGRVTRLDPDERELQ